MLKKLQKVTKQVKTFANKVIHGRDDFSPAAKKILKQYGDVQVVSITVFRHPLNELLVSAIDMIGNQNFRKNIENSPYDKLFHLGLIATLKDGTRVLVEKTEVITLVVNPKADKTDEFLEVPSVPSDLTLNIMLFHCREKMGGNFFTYASSNNNCQYFCLALLQSNFMNSPEIIEFVKQDTVELFENTGYLNNIANSVTDLAGRFNVLIQGGDLHRKVALIHHRKINDFNNATRKVFQMMSVSGKYNLIGSSQNKTILYNNDYDLEEFDSSPSADKIYHLFKLKFEEAMKTPGYFIIDFKCGELKGEPLRWSYRNMMSGMNRGVSFEQALFSKKTVKLDFIVLVSGRFLEFSENYYFKIDGVPMYEKVDDKAVEKSLMEDAESLYSDNKFFKYLKRMYAVAALRGEVHKMEKYTEIFNGSMGYYYKQMCDLKIIVLLLEQTFKKVDRADVVSNLQAIKQNLSFYANDVCIYAANGIDTICEMKSNKRMVGGLEKIIKAIDGQINVVLGKEFKKTSLKK